MYLLLTILFTIKLYAHIDIFKKYTTIFKTTVTAVSSAAS